MPARRFTTILPAITLAEAIKTTQIHRVAGLTGDRTALVTTRPCRAPHHTIAVATRNVRVTTAVVLRHLRVWAQALREHRSALRINLSGDDLVRRGVVLDPLLKRRDPVGLIRASAAPAVADARHHVQPEVCAQRGILFLDRLAVLDRSHHRQRRVRPAVPHDELAAARLELAEIGIRGIEQLRRRGGPLAPVREIEIRVAPIRIVQDEILRELRAQREVHVRHARRRRWLRRPCRSLLEVAGAHASDGRRSDASSVDYT
jgi:magnesium chelatase subunit ChlI-like protein